MPEGGSHNSTIEIADVLARAAALGAVLKARRAAALRNRRLSDETIADLSGAGLFKILQPAKFGGLELAYGSQVPLSAKIAEACGAAGWITSVVATHHWLLGKFDPNAQADVWGKDPNTIVCSAFGFAEATVTPVEGGYRATGRWTYSSGSHAAQWAMIGFPAMAEHGKPPIRKFAIVPRSDFTVLDNWHSVALRGSGSNDIVIKDAFIPAYRTVGFDVIDRLDHPGSAVNTGPTYRLPSFGVFNLTGVGPSLGLAQSALCAFAENMKHRRSVFGSRVAELQSIQMRAAEAGAEIDAAQLIADAHIRDLQSAALAGNGMTPAALAKLQRDCAYVGRLCQNAVGRLVEALGAGGLSDGNDVQMNQADLKGVCAHITMGWDANCAPFGKHLMGVESKN